MDFPDDLIPLPTSPFDERPNSLPLDVEECRTALWLERGNITKAAARIKTSPARFRTFVSNSARLRAEQNEARQQMADRAEEVLHEALHDESDSGRRDSAAKWVLDRIGKDRGFSTSGAANSVRLNVGPISVEWLSEPIKVIEHDPNE